MNYFLSTLSQPREQWAMSAADNVYGMSLPEYHPESLNYSPIPADFYDSTVETTSSIPAETIVPLAVMSANSTPKGNSSGMTGLLGGNSPLDSIGNMSILSSMLTKSKDELKTGVGLKSMAAAGEFFSKALTYSMNWHNADRIAKNTRLNAENQMLAIDNQVQYYKNQIADKFGKTMARNAMTMAAKNLRVTAGNLLEQTKDAAYDATKDIATLESNAELKKIALRSEERQANVARHLTKQLLASDLIGSAVKLGLIGYTGYNKLYGSKESSKETSDSLNNSIYGS